MAYYIKDQDLLDLLDENGRLMLTAAKINEEAERAMEGHKHD